MYLGLYRGPPILGNYHILNPEPRNKQKDKQNSALRPGPAAGLVGGCPVEPHASGPWIFFRLELVLGPGL